MSKGFHRTVLALILALSPIIVWGQNLNGSSIPIPPPAAQIKFAWNTTKGFGPNTLTGQTLCAIDVSGLSAGTLALVGGNSLQAISVFPYNSSTAQATITTNGEYFANVAGLPQIGMTATGVPGTTNVGVSCQYGFNSSGGGGGGSSPQNTSSPSAGANILITGSFPYSIAAVTQSPAPTICPSAGANITVTGSFPCTITGVGGGSGYPTPLVSASPGVTVTTSPGPPVQYTVGLNLGNCLAIVSTAVAYNCATPYPTPQATASAAVPCLAASTAPGPPVVFNYTFTCPTVGPQATPSPTASDSAITITGTWPYTIGFNSAQPDANTWAALQTFSAGFTAAAESFHTNFLDVNYNATTGCDAGAGPTVPLCILGTSTVGIALGPVNGSWASGTSVNAMQLCMYDWSGGGTLGHACISYGPTGNLVLGTNASEVTTAGNPIQTQRLYQHADADYSSQCTMTTTTCTVTLNNAYSSASNTNCFATVRGSTPYYAAVSVAGAVVTVTANASNTATWNVICVGDPS